MDQNKTPFLTALKEYIDSEPICFDVPGHKMGSFKDDFTAILGNDIRRFDVNAPIGLDNLYNTRGVLKEAEELAAEAFHADHCLFSVNGTSGGILSMITACLDIHDKIILPRNVHKSIINALIISGAVPIYVDPLIDEKLGVACGVTVEAYIKAMDENRYAKAVMIINPTYFGVVSDLKRITYEAHKRGMIVMADEAHGSNFYFSDRLPLSAMDADVDISACSMHKNSGSLTQSSVILIKGNRVDLYEVKKAFAMFSSTSPNHLLLASIDSSRKEMVLHGKEIIDDNLNLAMYAREELNKIKGIHVYGKEYLKEHNSSAVYDIDLTKLVIDVSGLNMYGYDVYKEIKKVSNVQLELGEISVVLAIIGSGTTKNHVDRLIQAFARISMDHYKDDKMELFFNYSHRYPRMALSPRDAYDSKHKILTLDESIGQISAETVMAYPPGIPIIVPGEIISKDVISTIKFYMDEGGEVLKDTPSGYIKVVE